MGEAILDAVIGNLPDPPAVRIADMPTGDTSALVLAETESAPRAGTVAEVTAGGRMWQVTVDDLQPTSTAAPWWILGATGALALLIILLAWRAVRHQHEVDRHVDTIERLADRIRRDAIGSRLLARLAEAAATARTTEQVARTLVSGTVELPGAKSSHIGVLSDDGRSLVVVQRGTDALDEEIDVRPLGDPWPITDAFRRSETLLLGNLDQVAERYPEVVDGMRTAGMEALACLPLTGEDGRAFGVLAVTWPTPQQFDDDLVGALHTVADLCRSSLVRARTTDRAHGQAAALATLASHLAAATTFDEVGVTIAEHATAALGAELTLVGVVDDVHFRLLVPDTPALAPLTRYRDISVDDEFPAGPLDADELLAIEEDLADLTEFRRLLAPTGVKGVAVQCEDCAEEHYHEWDMLRANLMQLLEDGSLLPHEPAFDPLPRWAVEVEGDLVSVRLAGNSSALAQDGRVGSGVAGDSYRRGRDTRQDRLQSEITARVTAVNPDGSLRLEGRKRLVIDEHEQEVVVTGVIRSNDVSPGNTIESWRLAEAEILYATNGELGKPKKSLIMKLLGFLWP